MSTIKTRIMCTTVLLALMGCFAFTGASQAAEGVDPSPDMMSQAPEATGKSQGIKMAHSPEAMAQRVEMRIKTLHDKLHITSAEEAKWSDVAQAMRDNEATINQLIEARHQNPDAMTAIEDLQSYAKIAQAHVDGLQKLIPAFQALYNDMSDAQRKQADDVFGRFEGHRADQSVTKHK